MTEAESRSARCDSKAGRRRFSGPSASMAGRKCSLHDASNCCFSVLLAFRPHHRLRAVGFADVNP